MLPLRTWERWQLSGTPHSPKLQYCWSLTIRLFSVIKRSLVGEGVSLPYRDAVGVFCCSRWLGQCCLYLSVCVYICLAMIHIQLYTYRCRNIVNTIMTNEHSSLEKYTSHTLFERVAKGLYVRGELGTEQIATYWPLSSLVFSSTSFSFCWAAQSGVSRAHSPLLGAGSLYSIGSPTNWLQLSGTVCRTGLYHCLTFTCFLWASHLHRIQPVHGQGYILMSSTGYTSSLIDGWIEGQYVTIRVYIYIYIYIYRVQN